ncbi:ATP-grasp domain-containing protein [Candidatus Kaiserbacteria bacterium]|nr:MAG: ATP-grasp domain-containing protein [Candidatus Kaiserbacteria bacterium]
MESALILDGNLKSALASVRSLGGRGITVSVGATRSTGMALHSRFATAVFTYPSPYTHQEGFIEAVKREALRLGGQPVVYAFSDATWLSLYAYREALASHMTLIFPSETSVDIAFDKAATYSLAHISGVHTIPTQAPVTHEEILHLSQSVEYPVVVKSRRSVTWKDGVGIFGTASFAQNAMALVSQFEKITQESGESPLIQTCIFGEEYGVEMLAHKGKPFVLAMHHRLRSLSPTGGASVLKETIGEGDLYHELRGYAEVLVKKLAWSGPIMVEFKVDGDTRKPYLMEINGRFWGSLPLSMAAGADMPYQYFIYATTGKVPSQIAYAREGVVSNHRMGDIMHLLRVLFKRDAMRSLLYPKRTSALQSFCALPKGTVSDVWSLHDPKPALMEIIDIFKKLFPSK